MWVCGGSNCFVDWICNGVVSDTGRRIDQGSQEILDSAKSKDDYKRAAYTKPTTTLAVFDDKHKQEKRSNRLC
jgi:hypothetical protein